MLSVIWHDYLFAPLLNLLIYLYNGIAFENLGLAVVYMTVALRLALIPLSIIAERNTYKYEKIQKDISTIEQEFKDDPVERKAHIRELLHLNKIHPWAAGVLLGIQLLALVLLYQVFVGGMGGKLTALYPSVSRPDVINTGFLGFNVALRNYYADGLVAFLLYLQVWRSQRSRRDLLDRRDILFRYTFPLAVFAVLFSLPSVKAVFILTAMACSYIIHLFRPFFTKHLQAVKHTALLLHDKITQANHTDDAKKE